MGCDEMHAATESASALCENLRLSSDDGKFVKTHSLHPDYPDYPDANSAGVKPARAA